MINASTIVRRSPRISSPELCESSLKYVRIDGVRLGVRIDVVADATELKRVLPPGAEEENKAGSECLFTLGINPECPDLYTIRKNGRPTAQRYTRIAALAELRKQIELHIAVHATTLTFVHAGVALLNGRLIICPGRSGAGKSTLIHALTEAGATYYSDEFALIDSFGRVAPFRVPIGLRNADGSRSDLCIPGDVANAVPGRPGLLLFSEYHPKGNWRPVRLTPGIASLLLLRNAVAARAHPHRVLRAIGQIVSDVPAYRGRRSDTASVIDWIANDRFQQE